MKRIAFDSETTGIKPGSRAVEMAAILFDEDGVYDVFETLVNPGMPITQDAMFVHQITNEMVADAPDTATALTAFFSWVASTGVTELVGHYVCFDTGVLSWEAGRCGLALPEGLVVHDTCEMAKHLKATKNNKLPTLVEHYRLTLRGTPHRALCDADACRQYFTLAEKAGVPLSRLPWDHAGHNYAYTDALPSELTALPDLVAAGAPLTFTYRDSKGAETERTITPWGWYTQNDELYFNGLCHLRDRELRESGAERKQGDAERTFRADRVLAVMEAAA